MPLAFLSPDLQCAILDGSQPADLNLARLMQNRIPLSWTEQENLFGASASDRFSKPELPGFRGFCLICLFRDPVLLFPHPVMGPKQPVLHNYWKVRQAIEIASELNVHHPISRKILPVFA